MFAKGNKYTATNVRTNETFPVVCTNATVFGVKFADVKGNEYKCYYYDSAMTYTMRARDNHKHVVVKAAV